jgi:hypothetical protein
MSILFGDDVPCYAEQLELCRRLNARGHHRKTEQRPRPTGQQRSLFQESEQSQPRPTKQQQSKPPARLEARPTRRQRQPYLIWSNPNPPQRQR